MQKKIADHSYQTEDVIQRALAYAQNDARLCAVEVRQAAKLCQMMADRDMKDYLETSTQRFCERMYNLIYFIQGIKEDDPKSGDGLQLIRAVRGLFNISIVIGARGCIVNQMFEKEEVRLTGIRVKALQRESDEAWAEQVGMASREGWIWHSKEKEWRPAYTQQPNTRRPRKRRALAMRRCRTLIGKSRTFHQAQRTRQWRERGWREWLLVEGLGRNHLLMSTRPRPNGCVIRSRLLQL